MSAHRSEPDTVWNETGETWLSVTAEEKESQDWLSWSGNRALLAGAPGNKGPGFPAATGSKVQGWPRGCGGKLKWVKSSTCAHELLTCVKGLWKTEVRILT